MKRGRKREGDGKSRRKKRENRKEEKTDGRKGQLLYLK